MEERNKVTSIFKSEDPKKLEVPKAACLKDEIRFYLNDTQYFAAIENQKGCVVILSEEKEEECNKKSENSINREKLKEFIKFCSVTLGILLLGSIDVEDASRIINNILALIFNMNIIRFITNIASVVVIEAMTTNPSIRSKHSAEHMMANFLEINKRLPKNIEEVKKTSRFTPECGSRKLIEGFAEDLIRGIVPIIFTMSVRVIIVSNFSAMFLTNGTVLLGP